MAPVVAEVALENRNTFAVAKYDMDDNRKITGEYQVRGRPAYVVFQDGEIVERFSGVTAKNTFVKKILDAIVVE
jgi:thioredoxin 1